MVKKSLFAALLICLAVVAPAQQFGPWSAPVHIGSPVSTAVYADLSPGISRDGLSLYFLCMRGSKKTDAITGEFIYPACPNGDGIYVSQRASVNDQNWGAPQFVMPGDSPTFSLDGHRMYFSAPGTSGIDGDDDIYVSRRQDKDDNFGWRTPEPLTAINSIAAEGSATSFEDQATGVTYLYFSSKRTDLGGPGEFDIYVSKLFPGQETFGPPVLVAELSSSAMDNHPMVRRDGLEIFFLSNRCGSLLNAAGSPSPDIWTSTRASISDPWSPPLNIDADPLGLTVCPGMPPVKANVNTGRHDNKPSLSFDGTTLYFGAAQRPGNLGVGCPYAATCFFDVWMTTREKLTGPKTEDH